jgi:hypothetical protein
VKRPRGGRGQEGGRACGRNDTRRNGGTVW